MWDFQTSCVQHFTRLPLISKLRPHSPRFSSALLVSAWLLTSLYISCSSFLYSPTESQQVASAWWARSNCSLFLFVLSDKRQFVKVVFTTVSSARVERLSVYNSEWMFQVPRFLIVIFVFNCFVFLWIDFSFSLFLTPLVSLICGLTLNTKSPARTTTWNGEDRQYWHTNWHTR